MSAVYVGDDAGKLNDTASVTKELIAGYISALADATKVLLVNGLAV
jgi:hypothetical protein